MNPASSFQIAMPRFAHLLFLSYAACLCHGVRKLAQLSGHAGMEAGNKPVRMIGSSSNPQSLAEFKSEAAFTPFPKRLRPHSRNPAVTGRREFRHGPSQMEPFTFAGRSKLPMMRNGDNSNQGADVIVREVLTEVARSVSADVSAPDTERTFVSMDSERERLVDEEGLPIVYDKETIQKFWDGQGGALQQRWLEFLGNAVPFITRVAGLLIRGGAEALEGEAGSLALDARESIERLGPTYIKLGQTLSVRPDILPQEALNELAVLQDNVQGYPNREAYAVIEQEFGRPLTEVFSEFAEEPVAAASLAQVYKARLRETGEEVAVKVQRPGVRALVSKDLYVLRRAAEVFQALVDRFAATQRTSYVALLNEWAIGFYTELNFKNEAANMGKMRTLLNQQNITDVLVPKVYDEYSSTRVLVTQWVDGEKLSACTPEQIKELISIGQECFLVQLLQLGFFHSDPHPGNLLRLNDQSGQYKLALIDFGLVAIVEQRDIDSMISAIIHLANKDYSALIEDFISLDILPEDTDRVKVLPLMDKALTPYVKGGGAKQYAEEVRDMYGVDVDAVGGFQAITQDFLSVLNDVPFSIPPYFALLARAVVTLEGLALTANPKYGLIMEAYPFVARKLLAEGRAETQQVLQELLYGTGPGSEGGAFTPARLASLINSAAGIVAKEDGAVFASLDLIPEDGMTFEEAVRVLLSDKTASLRNLLKREAITVVDLLLRQALRKGTPALLASLPSLPQLPLGPSPPSPLTLRGPFLLPPIGDQPARPLWISPQDLLEAIAPKLTREEELYAISIVDLVRSSLGDDAAAVVSGDAITDPLPALRVLLTALVAAEPVNGSATGPAASLPPQVYAFSRQLQQAIGSARTAPSGAAVDSASGEQVRDISATLSGLTADEQGVLQETFNEISTAVLHKLQDRTSTLESGEFF